MMISITWLRAEMLFCLLLDPWHSTAHDMRKEPSQSLLNRNAPHINISQPIRHIGTLGPLSPSMEKVISKSQAGLETVPDVEIY